MIEAVVEGVGLHSGQPARVIVRARPGPVTLRVGGLEARIDELTVGSTARATTVEARGRARDGARAGPFRVGTVEHAFAALAGLGIYEGLGMDVEGPELPLLDGGASAWCAVIDGLGVMASAPRTRVARREVLTIGPSRYEFCTGEGVRLEVRLELAGFDERVVAPEAHWDGDASDFRARIAPARTFALGRDVDELAARGLARHVDPTSVVVLTPDGALSAGRPFEPDEPARHKLLDLVGDLYLYGGPPVGHVRAVRPGHAANALAMRRARDEGIVVSD
ncbi:MAG TPA: UDP-3-O-acyl-N-acetylglucosamine deacetylase [Polyangiaceae bacterium]